MARQQARAGFRKYSTESFSNKYGFNMNPPPVHAYWNARNATVLVAMIPLYFGVGELSKYLGANLPGYEGVLEFADSDKSPLKSLKFAEPQLPESK